MIAYPFAIRSHSLLAIAFLAGFAYCDGPADNNPKTVRPVPPLGIELNPDDVKALSNGLAELNSDIETLKRAESRLIADIEIFARAIRDALRHRELFSNRDIDNAKLVLREGRQRAKSMLAGEPYWTQQTGLVVRGYRSRIDQTVQPYGLVVPDNYSSQGTDQLRLDLWFHGRGERSSESVFIAERMQKVGRYAPANTIVLHPYGRYSNAFKFAGEVDVLEALEHAKQQYRIDDDRIAVRGFSMGGAGCWQMAVHYPDLFFVANPGAGFSETPEFLKVFQKETLAPTWYERKLWTMYDCPGYAVNLSQLPTVAYSGELDIQKQAADVMASAMAKHDIRLQHIIGANTKHNIDEASKAIVEQKLAELARAGRNRVPHQLHFATYTLKYNRCHWLTLTSLGEHWKQARVDGTIDVAESTIRLKTQNVTGLTISFAAGECPFPIRSTGITVIVENEDGVRRHNADGPFSDRSFQFAINHPSPSGLVKRHNLQGPIDDAFMDAFIIVQPTAEFQSAAVKNWALAEQKHLVEEWRRQFRGDAIVRLDREITDDDIGSSNLVLFGTPQSNQILRRIASALPVRWEGQHFSFGERGTKFNISHHAPILIFPNPLNPEKYVVLNSGFTYREYAYLNNARQVPKLPDWAVVDLRTPPDALWPGEVVDAGFFDEKWEWKRGPAEELWR